MAQNAWNGYQLQLVNGVTSWGVGDIVASKYTTGSVTGHVMTIFSLPAADGSIAPAGTTSYTLRVLDSTSSVHSFDTRGAYPWQGIGEGDVRVYVDANGAIVWWQWSLWRGGKLFYNGTSVPAGACPAAGAGFGACSAREITVGRLTFPPAP